MSELNDKLLEIKRQKDEYILPENLKKDVTVYGVTGTLEAGSGDVKLFDTIEHMQQDETAQEGDLAIVYREEIQPVTEESEFDICIFPNEVVLSEAFTGSIYGSFRPVDQTVRFRGEVDMSSSYFGFANRSAGGRIDVRYTSSDGITYTRTDGGEELQEFGTTIKWKSLGNPFNNVLGNFMKIDREYFDGLYEYKSNEYVMTKNQLNATPDYVCEKTFYGKNGVENGTLTTSVSNSFTDVNAEVYAKIQVQYNNMQPRILTDQDKDIDKNIRIIPSKTDGTPLLDTSNVTGMSDMFRGCSSLTSIPLLDTSNVTNMYYMFSDCTSLTTIPLLDTSSTTNTSYMFSNCKSLTTIPSLDTKKVTNMGGMFNGCTSLTTIPQFDTSSATDTSYTFSNCKSLTTIPLLDTNNVTDMTGMFQSCSSLTSIPLLDTSNVTNMVYMFGSCSSLTSIPLLDTSNVTNMYNMFSNCSSLTSIPLLDTSNVTNMNYMFGSCSSLTSIPLLDTSNATAMFGMFYDCKSLNNESLNNILVMCANAVKITSNNKTLKYIGLTEEQAQLCTTLSNYQAFVNAGWTTGY